MPAFLVKFLAPLAPYLAAACIALAAAFYIVTLRHEVVAASVRNAALAQLNQENLTQIAAYKVQQVRWNTALDALGAQTLATHDRTSAIIDDVAASPANADAPVAPVLANALNELRALQGAAP